MRRKWEDNVKKTIRDKEEKSEINLKTIKEPRRNEERKKIRRLGEDNVKKIRDEEERLKST